MSLGGKELTLEIPDQRAMELMLHVICGYTARTPGLDVITCGCKSALGPQALGEVGQKGNFVEAG